MLPHRRERITDTEILGERAIWPLRDEIVECLWGGIHLSKIAYRNSNCKPKIASRNFSSVSRNLQLHYKMQFMSRVLKTEPEPPGQVRGVIARRLRKAREAAGFPTAKAFSDKYEIPQSTYSLHETGSRPLRRETAERYAEKLGLKIADLGFSDAPAQDEGDFRIEEIDVRGGVENLDWEGRKILRVWSVPRDVIRGATSAPAHRLKIVQIHGNSMTPNFLPLDRVLVDLDDQSPTPPGFFVVFDGFGLMARQVQFLANSDPPRVRFSSLNEKYEPYERTMDAADIQGRILGKWQWV